MRAQFRKEGLERERARIQEEEGAEKLGKFVKALIKAGKLEPTRLLRHARLKTAAGALYFPDVLVRLKQLWLANEHDELMHLLYEAVNERAR